MGVPIVYDLLVLGNPFRRISYKLEGSGINTPSDSNFETL